MKFGSVSRLDARLGLPLIVFVLALALRLLGIGWGLKNELHNQSYHPDELPIWTYSQQLEPAKLKLSPGFYNYGTLYLTGLKIASDMTAAYTGAPDPKNEPSVWAYVSRCHLAGRIVNAVSGSIIVVLVFLILRRFTDNLGASAGALALLVAPGLVVHSRFQTVDVFAACLLAASVYFALRMVPVDRESFTEKHFSKFTLLSAAFAGLSAGTKYTGILGLVSLWVIVVAVRKSKGIPDLVASVFVALVTFVVATPGAITDTEAFKRDVGFEMSKTASGHGLVFAGTSNGYSYHFGNLMSGIGTVVVLLGLAGLAFAAYRKRLWAFSLLAFFLPYYYVIGGAQDKYLRYTFPLYLAIAVGFGYLVWLGHRRGGWARILVATSILGLGSSLAATARVTAWMMGEDPRDSAAKFVKKECIANPAAVVGLASDPWYWTPPFYPNTASPRFTPFARRIEEMNAVSQPRLAYYIPADGGHHPFDGRLITEIKPDFVCFSDLESQPRERLVGQNDVSADAKAAGAEFKQFADALNASYDPYKSFGEPGETVEDMLYIQPVVHLWKRKSVR